LHITGYIEICLDIFRASPTTRLGEIVSPADTIPSLRCVRWLSRTQSVAAQVAFESSKF
jgi:hypothetical protein